MNATSAVLTRSETEEKKLRRIGFRPIVARFENRLKPLGITQATAGVLLAALLCSLAALYIHLFMHFNMFEEGRPMTVYSVIQLELCGLLAWLTYKVRMPEAARMSWKERLQKWQDPRSFWLLAAAGFVYLGLDDLLTIHELIDKATLLVFGLHENSLTDRLDDLIQVGYALGGIAALVVYRRELWRYVFTLPFWAMAVACALGMLALDDLTSDKTIIYQYMEARPALEAQIHGWVAMIAPKTFMDTFQVNEAGRFVYGVVTSIEEIIKILAGSFFIAGLFACYKSCRTQEIDPHQKSTLQPAA